MPDSVKALRKEYDGLKKQLQQLTKDFESLKAKMVKRNEAMAASLPNQDDVQFLSDSNDNLVQSKDDIAQELSNLNRRLVELKENVGRIDKAIDELLFYSFQYNVKIIGVPQVNEKESSEEPAELCVKLFSGIGVDVSISDIDIAHRVPQRNTTNSNGRQRRQHNSIICRFTRRLVRDKVLTARNNASQLTVYNLELPSSATIDWIAIYSHLTPRLQELLHYAKNHQGTHHYKWCWAKGAAIFLRKTNLSPAI